MFWIVTIQFLYGVCQIVTASSLFLMPLTLHEYLDITIDYLIAGKLVFIIFDYLERDLWAFADLKSRRSYYPGNN